MQLLVSSVREKSKVLFLKVQYVRISDNINEKSHFWRNIHTVVSYRNTFNQTTEYFSLMFHSKLLGESSDVS